MQFIWHVFPGSFAIGINDEIEKFLNGVRLDDFPDS